MAVVKSDELIKYMTQRVVTYIETPREEREKTRASAKVTREPWLTRWFGWGPVGVMMWWKKQTSRQR
ncbi:YqzE family protein [Paenibacillus sp. GCM10023252]|uniref:YqzE family protein n=1 Tax=Paenibacillus sp. GCM10023252 TaxID=3252649 RepID=UPI00360BE901